MVRVAVGIAVLRLDAQDLAAQAGQVLRHRDRAGGERRGEVRIAHAGIQVTVRAEVQVAGVVNARIGGDIIDQDDFAGRVDRVADHGQPRDAVARSGLARGVGPISAGWAAGGLAGVIDVEKAVGGKGGIEGQTEQAALSVAAHVEGHRTGMQQRAVFEDTNAGEVDVSAGVAAALGDEDATVRGEGKITRGKQAGDNDFIDEACREAEPVRGADRPAGRQRSAEEHSQEKQDERKAEQAASFPTLPQ